jgi:hypothetical protein
LLFYHTIRPEPQKAEIFIATAVISSNLLFLVVCYNFVPIPVAVRSKAWVCGRTLAGNVGSNSAGGMDVVSLVSVVCFHIDVSASG